MSTLLIRNGTLLTMNPTRDVPKGDILIRDGVIAEIPSTSQQVVSILDARGMLVLPGFVQVHVHLNHVFVNRKGALLTTKRGPPLGSFPKMKDEN